MRSPPHTRLFPPSHPGHACRNPHNCYQEEGRPRNYEGEPWVRDVPCLRRLSPAYLVRRFKPDHGDHIPLPHVYAYPARPGLRPEGGNLYLRDVLRLPAKGLCPSAHPFFISLLRGSRKASLGGLVSFRGRIRRKLERRSTKRMTASSG